MTAANRITLTTARVRTLAETYGADISRWPEAEREAARVWCATHPEVAGRLLGEARALDHLLDAWTAPGPADSLRARVLAPAPAVVRSARRRSFVLTLGGGAGLAAACLAGILVAPVLLALPDPSLQPAWGAPAEAETREILNQLFTDWEAPVSGTEPDAAS